MERVSDELIIRYRQRWEWEVEQGVAGTRKVNLTNHVPRQQSVQQLMDPLERHFEPYERVVDLEFASVWSGPRGGTKRSADRTSHAVKAHRRWAVRREEPITVDILSCSSDDCVCLDRSLYAYDCLCTQAGVPCTQACHPGKTKCANYSEYDEFLIDHKVGDTFRQESNCPQFQNYAKRTRMKLAAPGEDFIWLSPTDVVEAGSHQFARKEGFGVSQDLRLMLRDHESCAICVRKQHLWTLSVA